jgi:tetratricopeptide (TPR) repeat protein
MNLAKTPFLLLLILMLAAVTSQVAGEQQAPTVRPWTYQKLEEAEELLTTEKYTQAIKLLEEILPKIDGVPYEVAVVKRMQASIHALREDYRKAASALRQALDTNALPERANQQAVVELAQLYGAMHDNAKVVALLESRLETMHEAPPHAYILLGTAYAQLKQYRKALAVTRRAIELTDSVPESWYQLLLGLHFELNQYKAAANVLEQLVRRYPDKEINWRQLVAVRMQLKQTNKALATTEMAYHRGLLNRKEDLMRQAQLCLYLGVPYKAGLLLEQEIGAGHLPADRERWELTANAWLQAKEWDKAFPALEQAAKLSKDGRNHLRLARLHVEREAWKEAAVALGEALNRGGLAEPGNAYLLLGIAHYENARPQEAKAAFDKASRYKKSRKNASQWLSYLKNN